MKYVIDEIYPWNIPTLIQDIVRLAAPIGDHVVFVQQGKKEHALLHNPTREEIAAALGADTQAVIIKRLRPEPGEPADEISRAASRSALEAAFAAAHRGQGESAIKLKDVDAGASSCYLVGDD
mgnify:CR=1 FL=1